MLSPASITSNFSLGTNSIGNFTIFSNLFINRPLLANSLFIVLLEHFKMILSSSFLISQSGTIFYCLKTITFRTLVQQVLRHWEPPITATGRYFSVRPG
jgi:hypothetical protein